MTVFLTHAPDMLDLYYGERALSALRSLTDVRVNPTGRVLDPEALVRHAAGCPIILSDRQTAGPAEVFDQLPDLVAFLRCAVDIRNIDVARASACGVLVTHATPGFATAVAELTIGLMLDLCRHVSGAVTAYRDGREADPVIGRQLRGATLGIVGFGRIAQELAPLARAFGMRVLAHDPVVAPDEPDVEAVGLARLLASSDIVVCLAVASDATENLFDGAAFAAMKPGALFVNPSRGNLVDEAALEAALESGQLGGAAIDVGRAPDQRPTLRLALRPDVVATPHIGGLTREAIEHQAFDTVEQVRALLEGRMPAGAANPDAATRLSRLARPR